MASTTCKNCGTNMDFAAKFCRRCGQPVDTSEATTRTLDEPERREAATRMTNSAVTSPTYEPPAYLLPQPAPTTNELKASSHKKNVMILAGVVGVLLIAVIVLAVVLLNQGPANPFRENRRGEQGIPAPPLPPPPPPPNASGLPAATEINSDLYYPGSRVIMEHTGRRGREGNVAQLQVSAPPETVAAWYIDKIKPETNTRMPGSIILEGKHIVVIINGAENQSHITLAYKKDR